DDGCAALTEVEVVREPLDVAVLAGRALAGEGGEVLCQDVPALVPSGDAERLGGVVVDEEDGVVGDLGPDLPEGLVVGPRGLRLPGVDHPGGVPARLGECDHPVGVRAYLDLTGLVVPYYLDHVSASLRSVVVARLDRGRVDGDVRIGIRSGPYRSAVDLGLEVEVRAHLLHVRDV